MGAIRYLNPWLFDGGFPGSIYFIQMGDLGPIKIGFSKNPKKRMARMQVACPFPLKLLYTTPGCKVTEKDLHKEHKHWHIKGEWFHPDREIFDTIEEFKRWDKKETEECAKHNLKWGN